MQKPSNVSFEVPHDDPSARNRSRDSKEASERTPRRRDRSALYEYSLFWVWPLITRAWKHAYNAETDSPPPPSLLDARTLIPRADELYAEERAKRSIFASPLTRVLLRLTPFETFVGLVASALQGVLTTAARPLMLRRIVKALGEPPTDANQRELVELIFALCGILLLEGITAIASKHALSDFCGSMWVVVLGGLVQRKTLRATTAHDQPLQPSTLFGNDVLRNFENIKFSCLLPTAVAALISGICVLVYTIRTAAIAGLVVMFLLLSVNALWATRAEEAEEKDLQAADSRIVQLRNVITNIGAVKLSGWESEFVRVLDECRSIEMRHLFAFRQIAQGTVQLGRSTPYVCAAASFVFLALTADHLDPADVYASLSVLYSLRLSVIILPESISYLTAMKVSMRRIEAYLELPEVVETSKSVKTRIDEDDSTKSRDVVVDVSGDFEWTGSDYAMRNVDFRVERGQKVAVVGSVGSGKSNLLAVLTGEMRPVKRKRLRSQKTTVVVPEDSEISPSPDDDDDDESDHASYAKIASRTTALVRQHPFIRSGTIHDNIRFGSSSSASLNVAEESERLDKAIRRSALEEDLVQFPYGLESEIGEGGVTLSGGQRARVSLCRALYSSADLMLVDDVIAAVDTKVAHSIFTNLMKDVDERRRTLVMALNQLERTSSFDWIVVMRNGAIVQQGPYETLKRDLRGEFRRLLVESGSFRENDAAAAVATNDDDEGEENDEKRKILKSKRLASYFGTTQTNLFADDEKDDNDHRRLVKDEFRAKGQISTDIVRKYVREMGRRLVFFCAISGASAYTLMALNDRYLSLFLEKQGEPDSISAKTFAVVYALGTTLFLLLLQTTSFLFNTAGVKSSANLHHECVERLLHAPLSYFQRTPSGRILSRFTTDLSVVDHVLSRFVDNFYQFLCTIIALTVLTVALVPFTGLVIVGASVLFGFQILAVDRANRETKRVQNERVSPLQSMLNAECMLGRDVIRAYKVENKVNDGFDSSAEQMDVRRLLVVVDHQLRDADLVLFILRRVHEHRSVRRDSDANLHIARIGGIGSELGSVDSLHALALCFYRFDSSAVVRVAGTTA